jgi:transporter family protein
MLSEVYRVKYLQTLDLKKLNQWGAKVESNYSWFFWAFLSAIFAALTTIFAKVGVQSVDSDLATLIRTGIVFLVLSLLILSTNKLAGISTISKNTWLFLSLSALGTGASWLCFYRALKLGDSSKVIAIDKFSIVLVMIVAVLFLDEKSSPKDWVGILMVSGGMILMTLKL